MASNTVSDIHFPATIKSSTDAYKAVDALRAASPVLAAINRTFYEENREPFDVLRALLAGDKPCSAAVAVAVASLLNANAARPDAPVRFARAARDARTALRAWMTANATDRIDTKNARAYLSDKNGALTLYVGAPTVNRKKAVLRKKKITLD